MNQYELLYIVPVQYTEDELAPIKQKVREVIEKAGGKISLEDSLGKKKLAYPIKKFFQGYFLLCHFELDGSKLGLLDKNLRLTEEILRHMIVSYEPKSAMKLEKIKESMRRASDNFEITEKEEIRPPKPIEKPEPKIEEKEKVNLEDLDKKLDEILKTDNLL